MGKETCLTPEQGVFQTSPSYVSQFCFRSLLWTAENAEMTLILARLCSVRMRNTSKNTGIRNIHRGVSFFCDLLKVSRLFVILIYHLKCSYSSWGKNLIKTLLRDFVEVSAVKIQALVVSPKPLSFFTPAAALLPQLVLAMQLSNDLDHFLNLTATGLVLAKLCLTQLNWHSALCFGSLQQNEHPRVEGTILLTLLVPTREIIMKPQSRHQI